MLETSSITMTLDWMLTRESSRGRRPPFGAGAGSSGNTGSVDCSAANRLPFADARSKFRSRSRLARIGKKNGVCRKVGSTDNPTHAKVIEFDVPASEIAPPNLVTK
jgi:hypothetical protein